MLSLTREEGTGILIVRGSGLWTVAQMEAHFVKFHALIGRIRDRGGMVRALIDLLDVGVQRQDVGNALTRGTRNCYRTGDRVAVIVPSSLAKMQMRRLLNSPFHNYFVSENAARIWLAGDGDIAAPAAESNALAEPHLRKNR